MNISRIFEQVASRLPSAKVAAQHDQDRILHKQAIDRKVLTDFLERNGELLASFNQTRQEIFRKLVAFSRINVIEDAPGVPTAKRAGDIADLALLALIERNALTFALETNESRAALEALPRSL